MPYFCSQIVETCPENIENNRFTSCSKFVSNGIDGKLCREWAEENPKLSDDTIINYCKEHETEDCSCVQENNPEVCGRYPCSKPSYLSTTAIKEKIELCSTRDNIDIDNEKNDINKSSSWILIIILLLFALIVIFTVLLLGNKYYGHKFFGFSKEVL